MSGHLELILEQDTHCNVCVVCTVVYRMALYKYVNVNPLLLQYEL
jgi:hypothetical protein